MEDHKITKEDIVKAERNGIGKGTLYTRVYNYCWEIDRATTEPINKPNKYGWTERKETALSNGISYDTYKHRIKRGVAPDEAATMRIMSKKEITQLRVEAAQKYYNRYRSEKLATHKRLFGSTGTR